MVGSSDKINLEIRRCARVGQTIIRMLKTLKSDFECNDCPLNRLGNFSSQAERLHRSARSNSPHGV